MPTLSFETTVAAPLARVWAWHQDVRAALPALCPPADKVVVESVGPDPPLQGTRVRVTARGPFGRTVRWVAVYVEFRPPHPVAFGEEARFVDEQEQGPFKSWRHEHDFEHVDEKTTRILDHLTYRVGWGPIGWLADHLIVRPRLRAMFRHRHEQLRRVFG